MTDIKIINKSNNPDPEFATNGSAGFDLRCNEYAELEPGEIKIVSTGLFFEFPNHLEMQIRPRSGLAAKNGITVLNTPGTIDSDYRGEIKVILINHGTEWFSIANGDRIAQGVISKIVGKEKINFITVDKLSDSERGLSGFGSTGTK